MNGLWLILLIFVAFVAKAGARLNNWVPEPNKRVLELPPATFTLFDNGASEGGVEMTLDPDNFPEPSSSTSDDSGELFAITMSKYQSVSKFKAVNTVATKAFREDGERITTYEQLLPTDEGMNRRVYLVADGLEFVWPFVSLGHNQTVSPNALPPIIGGEPVIVESLSDTPRVFRIHNLFSKDEADALMTNALSLEGANSLKRSTVGGHAGVGGDAHEDPTRTSDNAWDSTSPVAKAMISRSFQLTNIVEDAGKVDGLQIVRYKPGQAYNTHPDYFDDAADKKFDFNPYSGGSNRFATVFMYLNEPEEGGFTAFPGSPSITKPIDPPEHAMDVVGKSGWAPRLTHQCYRSLAVPAKFGTAALFYSITPDGRMDPKSNHAACPVISGLKWGANIWIWNRQRYGEIKTGDPRTLLIMNDTGQYVFITWEGTENGVINPGADMQIGTFEFHRFEAHLGSHDEKSFAQFTVQSEPEDQLWFIVLPRSYGITTEYEDVDEEL